MGFVRKHLWISGRVQGVYYRYSTQQIALHIGQLTGWVGNRRDGRVEAVVEGPSAKVEQLISWCYEGSSQAKVTHIEIQEELYTGEFQDFDIAY